MPVRVGLILRWPAGPSSVTMKLQPSLPMPMSASPIFHLNTYTIDDNVLSVPMQQQQGVANLFMVVNRYILKTLELLQRSFGIPKNPSITPRMHESTS